MKKITESVEELLTLINSDATIDTVYTQMYKMVQDTWKQSDIEPSEQEVVNKYMKEAFSVLKAELTWSKIKEPMIENYLKHYSKKEIQDMLKFYKSESGRSITKKNPAVTKDALIISQGLIKDILPKLQEMSEKLTKELEDTNI